MSVRTVIALLASLICANAATYYVATNGNDSADGAIGTPWLDISASVNKLTAGDTLYVRGGVYLDRVWDNSSGTAGNPITVAGYSNEVAVLDGEFVRPTSMGNALFQIEGSYWIVSNLTLRASGGVGLSVGKGVASNTFHSLTIYSNIQNGIATYGTHTRIEDCTVWECSLVTAGYPTNTTNSGGINIREDADYCTITNCTVFHVWGEAISTVQAVGTGISGCTVYDSLVPLYWMSTCDGVIENCLIYSTGARRDPNRQSNDTGILIGDEEGHGGSTNVVIRNNLIRGCYHSLYAWSLEATNGLVEFNIVGNTFGPVDGTRNVRLWALTNVNSKFVGNVVWDDEVTADLNRTGVTCTNNLWWPAVGTNMSGLGDVLADPLLRQSGSTAAGALTYHWFQLTSASPARGAGLADANLMTDYLGTPRGDPPDVGALQYIPLSTVHAGMIRAGILMGP